MKIVRDCFGRTVRLTEEQIAHLLQHPEMAGMEGEIERVLESPREVRVSRSDDTVQLFYEFYVQTRVGGKWLCVVVKYPPGDGFMVTAYLTDQLKPGETTGRNNMAEKVKVWFDPEADYLEVQFREAVGFMRPTAHDAVMERVDGQGHVLGFSVLGVSRFRKEHPLEAELVAE